jgi:hypothetical protein
MDELDFQIGNIVKDLNYIPLFYKGYDPSRSLKHRTKHYGRCYLVSAGFNRTHLEVVNPVKFNRLFMTLPAPNNPRYALKWRYLQFLPKQLRDSLDRRYYEESFMMLNGERVAWNNRPDFMDECWFSDIILNDGSVIKRVELTTDDIKNIENSFLERGGDGYHLVMRTYRMPSIPGLKERLCREAFRLKGIDISQELHQMDDARIMLYFNMASNFPWFDGHHHLADEKRIGKGGDKIFYLPERGGACEIVFFKRDISMAILERELDFDKDTGFVSGLVFKTGDPDDGMIRKVSAKITKYHTAMELEDFPESMFTKQ